MAIIDATKNFAKAEVSTGYDASATSIVLASGEGAKLPDPTSDGEFNLVWWDSSAYSDPSDDPNVEIVRCTARSTDTLTVTRGVESTSGSTKNAGGHTYHMALTVTAKTLDDLATAIDTRSIENFTAGDTLTSVETGKVCTNSGATTDIQLTLPTASTGLTFTFVVDAAYYLRINFSTGDNGRYLDTTSATAGYFRSNTVGDTIKVTAIDDTTWQVVSLDGTWSVDA